MRMPNPGQAIVDVEKLRNYCLDPTHPRGRHKARVFRSTLGLTDLYAEELQAALLAAALGDEAIPAERDDYGQRYVLDFTMRGPTGQARVRSIWIVRRGEGFPRLTTCYVL